MASNGMLKFSKNWSKRLAEPGDVITTFRRYHGKTPASRQTGKKIVLRFPDRDLHVEVVGISRYKAKYATEDFVKADADIEGEDWKEQWIDLLFSFYGRYYYKKEQVEEMMGIVYKMKVLKKDIKQPAELTLDDFF